MKLNRFLLALLVFLVAVFEVGSQTCPPCYKNRPRFVERHGYGGSGRPIVYIYIDWSTMQNFTQSGTTAIADAVNGAINGWNDATNPAVGSNAWDYQIPFEFEQTPDISKADIVVQNGQTPLNCIDMNSSTYPHVITFGANFMALSAAYKEGGMKMR